MKKVVTIMYKKLIVLHNNTVIRLFMRIIDYRSNLYAISFRFGVNLAFL
jgi:hypothetical protein